MAAKIPHECSSVDDGSTNLLLLRPLCEYFQQMNSEGQHS